MEESNSKKKSIIEKIKNYQINKDEKNKFFICITFIIYMLIILIVSYFHEAWEDESQSWLIARDLGAVDIIKQMRFEGHSFLWHYLLAIFAKNELNYEFSKIIMIIIAGITGILILKKAPYNKFVKILILASPVFLYYMPALLRPYALIPLMLILINIMNEKPEKYPILYGLVVAILANAHIITLGLACSIYLFYFKEQFLDKYKENSKKQNIKLIIGAIITSLGILIVLSCAVAGYLCSIAPTHGTDIPEELITRIISFARNLFIQLTGLEVSNIIILLINFIIFLVIIFESIKIDKKQGIIFFLGLIFYLFVQIFLFGIFTSQRTILIFVFLLYFSWNIKRKNIEKNRIDLIEFIIVLICIISIPNTIKLISDEIKYPYSDSKNTAQFIQDNIEKGSTILTVNWDTISAVQMYLSKEDYKFYNVPNKKYMTFATWNKFLDSNNEMYLENALKEFENSDQKLYLLNFISDGYSIETWKYFNKSKDKLKLLYITNEKCIARKAYLYEIIK